MLLAVRYSFSQAIMVGEQLPQEALESQTLMDGSSLTENHYKGKYLILEFWSTWCSTCIANMPKLDNYQKVFKDSLAILLVNSQDKKMVEEFGKNNAILKDVSLTSIIGDWKLKSHFPRKGVPYAVWLDPYLNVKYLTAGKYVTIENIRSFIEGRLIKAE